MIDDDKLCVVCMDNHRDHIVIPCGHNLFVSRMFTINNIKTTTTITLDQPPNDAPVVVTSFHFLHVTNGRSFTGIFLDKAQTNLCSSLDNQMHLPNGLVRNSFWRFN